jgi:hypothetical protein
MAKTNEEGRQVDALARAGYPPASRFGHELCGPFVTCSVGRPALSALWCRVYLCAQERREPRTAHGEGKP